MKQVLAIFSLAAAFLLSASASAGKIQAFNYHSNKGLVRVCKGDTSTGVAICADGTAVSAVAHGVAKPKWEVNNKAKTYYLKYSMGQEKSAVGRYAFFVYYSNRGDVRVCAGDTATGLAHCVDGTSESGQAMGTAQPNFTVSEKAKIFMLRYFDAQKGKAGRFGFMSYRNNRNLARICRTDTRNGETVCVDGTAVSADIKGQSKPQWKTSEKAKITYFKY